jgi:O-antigen/teichoic acid export membrane protein
VAFGKDIMKAAVTWIQPLLPLARNTGATVLARGLPGLTRLVLLILIARAFGPDAFGRLALALTLIEVVRVLADLGTDSVTIRRFSQDRSGSGALLANVMGLKLVTATVGYILCLVTYLLFYPSGTGIGVVLVAAASLYTGLLLNALSSYFQANLTMARVLLASVISSAVYLAGTLYGIHAGWPLFAVVAVIPLAELVNLAWALTVIEMDRRPRPRFDRAVLVSLLRESLPAAIGGIAVVLYSRTDNLFLGWFVGDRGLGEYAVAFRLTEPFLLLCSSFSLSLYATLSEHATATSPERLGRTLRSGLAIAGSIGVFSGVLLTLVARPLLGWISPEYAASAHILQFLAWSILFKGINAQLTAYISSRGRFRQLTLITLIDLGANLFLNVLLVPRFGAIGAALAVLATEGMNTLMQATVVAGSLTALVRTVPAEPSGSAK